MAVTLSGTPTFNGGASATTVNVPAGGASGDYYIMSVLVQDEDVTPPTLSVTGFTSITSITGDTGSPGSYWYVQWFSRAHDGTEGSTFSISGMSTWRYFTCSIASGWDGSTIDVGAFSQITTSGSLSVSGVTVSQADSLGLIAFADYDPATVTAPAGWTGYAGTFDASWVIAESPLAAGATGSLSVGRNTTQRAAGQLIVLGDAGGTPATPGLWPRSSRRV